MNFIILIKFLEHLIFFYKKNKKVSSHLGKGPIMKFKKGYIIN